MVCRWISFLTFTLTAFAPLAAAPMPAELAEALADFRAEGSPHWAFTQVTAGEGKSLVERYDPSKSNPQHWTLVEKDGHAPSVTDLTKYREDHAHLNNGLTAPSVKDQIVPDSAELVSDDGTRATWRFRLQPGGPDDSSAEHMAASFTLHRPTATIEQVELASIEPFSPVFLVKIKEARTTMRYTLPTPEQPTLLQKVTMRVRGRAMWFKSVDSDLTVDYRDYAPAGPAVP